MYAVDLVNSLCSEKMLLFRMSTTTPRVSSLLLLAMAMSCILSGNIADANMDAGVDADASVPHTKIGMESTGNGYQQEEATFQLAALKLVVEKAGLASRIIRFDGIDDQFSVFEVLEGVGIRSVDHVLKLRVEDYNELIGLTKTEAEVLIKFARHASQHLSQKESQGRHEGKKKSAEWGATHDAVLKRLLSFYRQRNMKQELEDIDRARRLVHVFVQKNKVEELFNKLSEDHKKATYNQHDDIDDKEDENEYIKKYDALMRKVLKFYSDRGLGEHYPVPGDDKKTKNLVNKYIDREEWLFEKLEHRYGKTIEDWEQMKNSESAKRDHWSANGRGGMYSGGQDRFSEEPSKNEPNRGNNYGERCILDLGKQLSSSISPIGMGFFFAYFLLLEVFTRLVESAEGTAAKAKYTRIFLCLTGGCSQGLFFLYRRTLCQRTSNNTFAQGMCSDIPLDQLMHDRPNSKYIEALKKTDSLMGMLLIFVSAGFALLTPPWFYFSVVGIECLIWLRSKNLPAQQHGLANENIAILKRWYGLIPWRCARSIRSWSGKRVPSRLAVGLEDAWAGYFVSIVLSKLLPHYMSNLSSIPSYAGFALALWRLGRSKNMNFDCYDKEWD